jgi:hypothetical protein
VRLRWCLRAWLGPLCTSWGQQEAAAEAIEPRPAKHLALEHLQAIDVPCDGSLTPGPRHPGLDGGIVLTQPLRQALEWRESARGGAHQPRIELGRLALADAGGEVLRERDGLCQGGMFGEWRQGVVIHIPERFWRAENQPGRTAGGERASWRFSHRRPRLSARAWPGCEPLGLAQAPDRPGHDTRLATQTLAADRAEERRPMATPAVPTGQEGGFGRIEEAPVTVMPRLALGKRRALKLPLHGPPTAPDMVRHRVQGPALLMVRPDLRVVSHPLRPPSGGEAQRSGGRRLGRERHGRDTQGRASGIVHRRRRTGGPGIDQR